MNIKKVIKNTLLVIFLLGLYLCVIFGMAQINELYKENIKTETEIETETEEIESETSTETGYKPPVQVPNTIDMYEYNGYYYMICRVVECNKETFTVILPNGETKVLDMIQDPPVDDELNPYFQRITFVVLVEDYDDVTKWEARFPH